MASIKPLKLYSHSPSPNPFKVMIILEELGLSYELEEVDFSEIKQEPFISVNPNGRLPALEDPNTGIVLWESAAIIEYLLDQYDQDFKLHSGSSPQKYHEATWKHFQMSGQGPYYGQLAWFTMFHPEKNLKSAIDRYAAEVRRVIGVIELHLTKTGQTHLVGNQVSFVDLMWFPWNDMAGQYLLGEGGAEEWQKTWPKSYEWHQKLAERESVKVAQEKRDAAKTQ
ncbi:Putative glutathione S-transferase, Thioredoxin-like superfamily, glutathione Transferase family [Septoria linicola]|uniref:Glutathione S-transferase, Thioredoxin-like superfamily, glutathione Transferase family n=1 Tax=Septoria linicola TaxID=215465 RepID=A0A9Q9B377_9PEZI|nr:Putative glutathione S-transferase, Thioredoxin-like superfamily, glutathione Transferase family [Septoria linicola]